MLLSLNSSSPQSNEVLKDYISKFEIPDKNDLRLFSSMSESLTEVVRGLIGLFPHKKKILIIKGGSPLVDSLIQFLSAEAMEPIVFTWTELEKQKEELLKEDFCFCFFSEDNLLTGEKNPFKVWMSELNKARKFSVSVSYRNHLNDLELIKEADPFRARIFQWLENSSLLVLGSRLRKLPPAQIAGSLVNEFSLNEFKVKIWEEIRFQSMQLPPEFKEHSYIKSINSSPENLQDRIVLQLSSFDTYAVKELLLEKIAGCGNLVQTGSLCEWGGIRKLEWVGAEILASELIAFHCDFFNQHSRLILDSILEVKELMGEPL